MLTIPGSTCTNERCFSALRRLENYLRTTMSQNRLNNTAILHIYHDMVDKIDIEKLLNKCITQNSIQFRRACFQSPRNHFHSLISLQQIQ